MNMHKWLPGLLLGVFLSAPASAQIGLPTSDGPLNRARQMQREAEQMRSDSRATTPTTTGTTPSKATTPSKSTTGGTSTKASASSKKMPPLDREALQAAKAGQDATYREKVELGANITATDESGDSALHLAAYKGHTTIVEFVLAQKGVLVDARDTAGLTPLMFAASEARDDSLNLLIKAGADVKIKTSEGTTALHRAAAQGHATTVALLLKAGADPTTADNQGRTAAAWAEKKRKGNWEDVVRILKEASPTT